MGRCSPLICLVLLSVCLCVLCECVPPCLCVRVCASMCARTCACVCVRVWAPPWRATARVPLSAVKTTCTRRSGRFAVSHYNAAVMQRPHVTSSVSPPRVPKMGPSHRGWGCPPPQALHTTVHTAVTHGPPRWLRDI